MRTIYLDINIRDFDEARVKDIVKVLDQYLDITDWEKLDDTTVVFGTKETDLESNEEVKKMILTLVQCANNKYCNISMVFQTERKTPCRYL